MMKLRLTLFMVLLLLLASCSNAADKSSGEASGPFYYTANEGGSISKINAVNNTLAGTIKLDGSVHNVQVSPDGKLLGATLVPKMAQHSADTDNHGHSHNMKMNGTALFYDTKTDKLVKKVEVGNHPAHIVFTEDNKYALVTNNEDNNVSVIDTKTFEIVKTVLTGNAPHGFRISKDNKYAYIANMGEDTVSVLDLTGFAELKKIKVGGTPVTTGITSDGKTLVVTLNAENAVAIVDLTTGKVDKVSVGAGPAQVFISPDDRYAYVADQGTEESPSHSLTKIDIGARKAAATIETGKGTHGVATSRDGKFVYATNMFDNTVSVIDNEQNKVVSTVQVGKTPNGISFQ